MESLPTIKFDHPLYKPATSADADGVAWIWLDTKEMKPSAFKFPELRDFEIRGDVLFSGLCYTDVHLARGDFGARTTPTVPGHEVVARVTQIGSAVKDLKVGDRVGFGYQRDCCDKCDICKSTHDNLCQSLSAAEFPVAAFYWGGYATAIQQPEKFAFKIPEGIADEHVPDLMCAGITLYAPIARHCKPGQSVAILGVGGLGHLGLQFATKLGCKVTAFSGTVDKSDLIKSLGAERIVDSSNIEAIKAEKNKFDVVINTLPGLDGVRNSLLIDCVKPNGTFVYLGLQPKVEISPIFPLVLKQVNMVGSFIGSRKEMKEMLEFSAKHSVKPVCEFFNFEDFPTAFDKLENGRPKFRCVVKCGEYAKQHNLAKSK